MFRKSILASALSLALLPSAAVALGLGGIRTQSALNEPFVGQVDLLDTNPDELDTVKVLLASRSEFDKVGATRPHFLTRLKFQAQVAPNGRTVIRVTSNEPVREPFLDFLIEVNWPRGRLVKEYTVLLDPPVTLDRRAPPVTRPTLQRSTPRRAPASGARVAPPPASVDTSAFPLRHGPVKRGSGLWRIARGMAPATGATVAQTAMALYRNNQQAFIRGDINKLKVNKVLEIPTAAELFALDTWTAEQEFKSALRGERVTTTPLTDITSAPQPKDRLEIAGMAKPAATTQVPSTVAEGGLPEAGAQAPAEQVPSQIDGAPASGEPRPELGGIKEDLLLIQETGESTRQETQELRGRIRELEGQLADIQRLLELSNERFAALQQTKAEQLDTPDTDAIEAEVAQEESPDTEVVATLDTDMDTPVSTPPQGPENTLKTADAGVDSSSSRSFWDSIFHSPLALPLTLGLLLLILGAIFLRRRRTLEEALTPTGLAPEIPASTAGITADTPATKQTPADEALAETPATSSPYGEIGMDGESPEADVISEADVYIAYGRYRDAEVLLEQATERSPNRLDIKYKLAEAYFGAGNTPRLEALVEQMRLDGADRTDPDRWHQLNVMLGNREGADAGGLSPASSDKQVPAAMGAAPTTPTFTPPIPPEPVREPESGTGPQSHAFKGSPFAANADNLQADSQDQFSQDLELDIEDLDVISGDLASPESEKTGEMAGATSDLELQFDDLESLKDTDLPGFSSPEPALEPVSTDILSSVPSDILVDSLDISPISKDAQESDIASAQWQVESSAWDEVATKIDLARAYLEMEDRDAAQVILEEVAQEGNESQRAEAREMMAQMT